MMRYPCYPALADGKFSKFPAFPSTICFFCIAWLPDKFSHSVFSWEFSIEFKKVIKLWHFQSFCLGGPQVFQGSRLENEIV